MGNRSLYICVDESGIESADDYFAVASCWFSSTNQPRAALNEAKVTLRDLLINCDQLPSGVREIKGKDLGSAGTDLFFDSFHQAIQQDNTIERGLMPWSGFPVRYKTIEMDVAVGRNALRNIDPNVPVEMSIRTMMLLSTLNPILYNSDFSTDAYDRVHVLLDGDIWTQPKEAIENTERATSLEFSIKDSKKTPGIQFADVAANLRFSARQGTEYDSAERTLSKLEF